MKRNKKKTVIIAQSDKKAKNAKRPTKYTTVYGEKNNRTLALLLQSIQCEVNLSIGELGQ